VKEDQYIRNEGEYTNTLPEEGGSRYESLVFKKKKVSRALLRGKSPSGQKSQGVN